MIINIKITYNKHVIDNIGDIYKCKIIMLNVD